MNTLRHRLNNSSEMLNTSLCLRGAVQFALKCSSYRRVCVCDAPDQELYYSRVNPTEKQEDDQLEEAMETSVAYISTVQYVYLDSYRRDGRSHLSGH